MSNSGGSRVSIPNNVRKTIQNIKEITSNHSEDDIYAMLKECSMDPNETTQRLLQLDSFHEVRRKRDKRKENVRSRPAEEVKWKPGHQGRGSRGARGSSYSQYTSNDAGGRRNAAAFRRENGLEESRDKGFKHFSVPVSRETDSTQPHHVEKSSSITVNGPVKVSNGSIIGGHSAQSSGVNNHLPKEDFNARADDSSSSVPPKPSAAEHAPSASDPVLVPSHDSRIPTAVGAIKREVRIQRMPAEPSAPTQSISNSRLNQHESLDGSEVSSSVSEKEPFGTKNMEQQKVSGEVPAAGKIHVPDSISAVKFSSPQGIGQGGAEEAASKLAKLKFSDSQHVIIPNHIQVPDAVKNFLSFGSLGASFGVRENNVNSESNEDDSAHDESPSKPSPCDQDGVLEAPEGSGDHPQSPSHTPGKNLSPNSAEVPSSAPVPKDDQLKEETLPAVGPPFPVVQTTPSYSFGFMPPMMASPLVQPEVLESQPHISNTLGGSSSSPAMSTSASTPPPTQPIPQPIPLFRQQFPPNYIPYSHYFSPFYVPPTMHQYFGHTAFPPPLPAGNVYLTQPGMKISPGAYKPGPTAGNQVPIMMSSGYGYSPNAGAVTSGNSSTSEDLVQSTLKENNGYPGHQNEGSGVWLPGAAGRDAPNFPLNSFLNLPPPQGQHVISPQSTHGAFAVYHAMQPMSTSAPPGLTLLHQHHHQSQPQPQAAAGGGPGEPVGPPSNAYQQQPPQRHQPQISWNMM